MLSFKTIYFFPSNSQNQIPMPCACKVPAEDYPESADWGPLFWKIIHTLSLHSGTMTNKIAQEDEVREWTRFTTALIKALPCDDCRSHYQSYLASHPYETVSNGPYQLFANHNKFWWYSFHNSVNARLGKPPFDYNNLQTTYETICVPATLAALQPVMKKAIRLGGVGLLSWNTFLKSCKLLISYYGVYKTPFFPYLH